LGSPGIRPEHERSIVAQIWDPGVYDAIRSTYRLYCRARFIWSVPASMNLFSAAILVDCARFVAGANSALALPVLVVLFGPSLAAKQVVNALLLLRLRDW
jgi:hypothetical protein